MTHCVSALISPSNIVGGTWLVYTQCYEEAVDDLPSRLVGQSAARGAGALEMLGRKSR